MHINKPLTDLKFNVAQLLREDIGGRRSYSFQENALLLDDETTLRQIEGEVRFTRTASGVLADADVRGVVETQCIRCLTAVQVPLELAFRDEFHSVVEVNTGSPLPKPAEDDPFFINENHLLDLGEAIREYALIDMPMRPLCREDCKGLCPQCGVDRNTTPCNCSDDDGDDRLSVLQQLLDKNR